MKINPYKTLTLWGAWAFISIVVYLTLYIDAKVWTFMENDPSRITWLIVGLFVIGVIGSGALVVMITFEGLVIDKIQKAAAKKGLFGITLTSINRASLRFFSALQDTLKADGQPDVEVLANIELAALHRTSHAIEVLGNLLITLGLIGTVMGLTLTLTGLTSSLEALGHDQELLLDGLRKAMGGMGTAFYTTLLGAVLGGILLRVFAQITENGVSQLYDNLMRICLIYCSADYKPTLARETRMLNSEMKLLDQNINKINRGFAASQETMAAFKEELNRFRKSASEGDDDESLDEMIKRHRAYCEVLRDEMHLINAVNRSWWARLMWLFGKR
ncbi:MAG: hypothetical protein GXP14_01560 [Gammaproteobacteria bacterium]|nr:hypothetical protein [Gammaproteobacteria bacterium]